MPNTFRFYIDDSGSRHPDRSPSEEMRRHDWFALGGVVVQESDIEPANQTIDTFRRRWHEMGGAPLHSVEIRNRHDSFHWLETATPERHRQFMTELTALVVGLPVLVLACVIDRPGYNARYAERYGTQRWQLCKTAFTIAVERAAKYAQMHRGRLRVYVERSDRKTEGRLKSYYEMLRTEGLPFDFESSAKHAPLSRDDFRRVLPITILARSGPAGKLQHIQRSGKSHSTAFERARIAGTKAEALSDISTYTNSNRIGLYPSWNPPSH